LLTPARIDIATTKDGANVISMTKWLRKASAEKPLSLAFATALWCFGALSGVALAEEPALFESRQLTPSGEYTQGIEGPAADSAGALFVVNFGRQGTIGKLKPGASRSELFATLPPGSIGNGIRFDREGRMFIADFKKHNVLVIESGATDAKVFFHSDQFNQPNDLAIAADGTLFASDPRFPHAGQIWRIARGADGKGSGQIMSSERTMGATNGIDLSPDGATLYVSEADTREVWAYRLEGTKLASPRLVKKFDRAELDGLRTDLDGKIYVARPLNGTIAVLAPDRPAESALVREISLRGKEPTNLAFGGSDGRSVFVTQRQGRFIESFRVDRPGREPCLQAPGLC
jgi:sugar lactone lactonase YvrE